MNISRCDLWWRACGPRGTRPLTREFPVGGRNSYPALLPPRSLGRNSRGSALGVLAVLLKPRFEPTEHM